MLQPRPLFTPVNLIPLKTKAFAQAMADTGAPHLPLNVLSDHQAVGSPALHKALLQKIERLLPWLERTLDKSDERWPTVPSDVLALDLALVPRQTHTPVGQSWDLAWVEIQAFTSMLPTCLTLWHAHKILNRTDGYLPHDPLPHGKDWREALRAWLAPHPATVLIEDHPADQLGWSDFAAARHWWGVAIHDWRDLEVDDQGQIWATLPDHPTHRQRAHHIWNRVVLPDLPGAERHRMEQQVLRQARHVTWHSHPGWYEALSKGALAEVPLADHETCHWVEHHAAEDLGGQWVAKPVTAHSGEGLIFDPTIDQLRALSRPRQWLIQRRFEPLPMGKTPDGAPLFGEIRCMLGLRPGQAPWVMVWIVRLSRNGVATMTGRATTAEEGMSLLYFPEGTAYRPDGC